MAEMTNRQLWREIMNYGEFHRLPMVHWRGWPETRERWEREGMPKGADEREYFHASPHARSIDLDLDLFPKFDEEQIEETSEYRIYRDEYGVVQQEWKAKSSIPHFIDFTLKDAAQWPEFKKRLQPDPRRIPADIDERIKFVEGSGEAIAIGQGSLMGWIRNWMGVENMSYLMYDAPDVYADMVMTIADLNCWAIDTVMARVHTTPDFAMGWEDVAGKNGPLISPAIFDKCVAPGYRKVRNKLESYGIHFLAIDCDGFMEPWLKNLIDAGVNIHFPIEIGTWNADPYLLRRKFGRDLHMIGGFNKLALEKGRAEIDAEIARRLPIIKEGGFLMMPDHLITPDTPLEDYKYYLERIRMLRF